MKKYLSFFAGALIVASAMVAFGFTPEGDKTQWKQITTIESVVPAKLGRSRMIATDSEGNMEEVKMQNFFSLTGINFGNVRENDQMITDRIQQLTDEGWELDEVTSGVYSSAKGSTGIFITRYLFKK